MPALTITKTYLNGNVLFQADLDNICNSVTTLLNTTLLDYQNVQTGGLLGTNLANGTIANAQLGSACVNTANIASSAVTTNQIAPFAVNTGNIASSAVGLAQLAPNISFPIGTQINAHYPLVANTNPVNPVGVIRGQVGAGSTIGLGEGWSVIRPATGNYTVLFNTPFNSAPIVVATTILTSGIVSLNFVAASSAQFVTVNTAGAATNIGFNFIATGEQLT